MVRSLRNKTKVRGMAFCCLIVIVIGCSGCIEDNSESKLPFDQSIVGSRSNFNGGGQSIAWGDNLVKIVANENTTFTYVMDKDVSPRQASLYSKTDEGDWQEGKSFRSFNPPNLLLDSQGFVYLIGLEPYTSSDETDVGRLFYVKFDEPNTISSSYTFEYFTPDTRGTEVTLDTFANGHYVAAIGEDDTILEINEVWPIESNPSFAFVARIYDPIEGNWSFEPVVTDLTERYSFQYAAVTDDYFHVLAIEDDPDDELKDVQLPYRFGAIKHFQRARDSTEWVESTLIDFNPTLSSLEISEIWLRHNDLLIDSKGIIHVLISYCVNADGEPRSCEGVHPTFYHYWKEESSTEWHSEPADASCACLRLWEREDGQLFYVRSNWNEQICLIPQGTTKRYIISNLDSPYIDDPSPFIAAARGGTRPSSKLELVIYPGIQEIEAVAISVDVSQL